MITLKGFVKFSFYEKATKIWKNLHLFWHYWVNTAVLSKQVEDFFQILWPSHNILTLWNRGEVICFWEKKPFHTQSLSEKNEGKNALKEIGENGENTLCNTGL